MRRATPMVVLVLVLVIAIAAGCGVQDGLRRQDPAPTRDVWAQQAETACAAAAGRMRELGLPALEDEAPALDPSRARGALVARRVGFVEVSELPAPAGLGAQIKTFTDAAVGGIDQLIAVSRAREAGDVIQQRTSRDRATVSLTSARDQAKALGLAACIP